MLETIVRLDEAYPRNWCHVMGNQIGSRKLAYGLIYQSHPGRLQANSFVPESAAGGRAPDCQSFYLQTS